MTEDLYPKESQRLDFLGHLEEFRRRILFCLAALCVLGIAMLAFGPRLMDILKYPARGIVTSFVFIAPAEGFMAYLLMTVLSAFLLSFPVILYQSYAFLAAAFDRPARFRMLAWLAGSLFLFAGGVLFSYFVALPVALKFLIGFGREIAEPTLSLGKYVAFFSGLILAGGILFQIPVLVALLADLGIVKASFLKKRRHYALVLILGVAAIVTPTQDVLNMIIFAFPMYLLYEVGILIACGIEKRKAKTRSASDGSVFLRA